MENTEIVSVGAVALISELAGQSARAADTTWNEGARASKGILPSRQLPVAYRRWDRVPPNARGGFARMTSSRMTRKNPSCDFGRHKLGFIIDVSAARPRQRSRASVLCLCAPKGGQL